MGGIVFTILFDFGADLMSNLDKFYWVGACVLAVSPLFQLTIWVFMAVTGLAILTIQAYQNKLWNLVAVNTVSIIAYLTNLI